MHSTHPPSPALAPPRLSARVAPAGPAAVRASLPWRSGCASPALTCPFPLVEGGEA